MDVLWKKSLNYISQLSITLNLSLIGKTVECDSDNGVNTIIYMKIQHSNLSCYVQPTNTGIQLMFNILVSSVLHLFYCGFLIFVFLQELNTPLSLEITITTVDVC